MAAPSADLGELRKWLIGAAAVLCIGIVALAVLAAEQLHARSVATAGMDLGQVANLLARFTDSTFSSIETLEAAVIREIGTGTATPETFPNGAATLKREYLAGGIAALPIVERLVILDTQGRVLASTMPGAVSHLPPGELTIEALRSAAGHSFLTRPWQNAETRRWTFSVAVPALNDEGVLLGAVIAVVDVSALEKSYAVFTLNSAGSVGLISNDGVVLTRYPPVDNGVGRVLPHDRLSSQAAQGYVRTVSRLDGLDRLVATRSLGTLPAYCAVTIEMDRVLAPWWFQVRLVFGGAALLVAAVIALAVLALRYVRSLDSLRRAQDAERIVQTELAHVRDREKLQGERVLEQMRFAAAIHALPEGLCCFDRDHRIVVSNQRYAELYGISPDLVRPGMHLAEVVELRQQAGIAPDMTPEAYLAWRIRIAEGENRSETSVSMTNGRTFVIKHQNLPGGGWVATHEDVTEQRSTAAQLAFMALHDSLTDLPNRVLFRERLDEATRRGEDGVVHALLLLDLDHFKTINDTLGHSAGDRLLQRVGRRLRDSLARDDVIARIGGDEFGVLQAGVLQPDDAVALAKRLIAALDRPFDVDGQPVIIGVTIGIALTPQDGRDPDDLLKCADMALYRTKEEGRGHYRLFEPEMRAAMLRRRSLEVDLRRATANGEFVVFYQPVVAVPTRRVLGYEALLRWCHPERGLISPDRFIPLAEEIGVIEPISEWVLSRACAEAASWAGEERIAVNLSAVQFSSRRTDLVHVIATALDQSGLPPYRLELEITETTLLRDTEAVLAILHALKALGVRIVMDDFGTGFSSLDYLRRFPFDKVKVDRSFIHTLSRDNPPVLRALNELCRAFSMHVTAEGVESEQQFAAVIVSGYTEAQGFLFGRPAPRVGDTPLKWGRL